MVCSRTTTAFAQAEAEKLAVVKAAEADSESKRLSGVGLAEQRRVGVVAGMGVRGGQVVSCPAHCLGPSDSLPRFRPERR